jgi:hypothetical protein
VTAISSIFVFDYRRRIAACRDCRKTQPEAFNGYFRDDLSRGVSACGAEGLGSRAQCSA